MTDQDINEAIALHLGWTKETKEIEHQDGYQWTEVVTHWRTPGGTRISCCEDYCNDLNAMHAIEEIELNPHDGSSDDYGDHIRKVIAIREGIELHEVNVWHAKSRQRAEAFLRTIGKWRTK